MGARQGVLERLMNVMHLENEPVPSRPLTEIAGDHRVLIENYIGLIEYSSAEITIKVLYGHLSVKGSGLRLLQMSKERLIIDGEIESVNVVRGI